VAGVTCSNLLTDDPRCVDAAGGNLRPQSTSPAIDAGNNATVPSGVATDLDGNPRFVDIPTVPGTGNGTPPIVDVAPMWATTPVVLRMTDSGGLFDEQTFTTTVRAKPGYAVFLPLVVKNMP